MSVRFGFVPVVPPFVGAHQEESVVAPYVPGLEALGGERWSGQDLSDPAPVLYLMVTGGTERVLLDLRERRAEHVSAEPVLLVAHPGNNSLPAALEVLARLHSDGVRGRICYLHGPDDADGYGAIASAVRMLSVRAGLAAARIGVVGEPSDWLVASTPTAAIVGEVWGPRVVSLPMRPLREGAGAADEEASAAHAGVLIEGATETREPDAAAIAAASAVHGALASIVAENALDAVTVRCFDLVLDPGTTGCVALAELTDAGVIAGCEGDVVSTVGLLWASRLLDEVPWMANPARLDEAAETVTLAHCTVPRGLVESYALRSHFESGLGVGIQGTLPLGPVTLLRIGGARMERLWVAEGEIVATGDEDDLCRTQVDVRLTSGSVRDLLTAPLGNHVVLVRGNHEKVLRAYWDLAVAPLAR
ncbi:MAG: fucose isomerase [Coriobacteriia bacterium]